MSSKRSQVTGRQIGKQAARSLQKNHETSHNFLRDLTSTRSPADVKHLCQTDVLAKIVRPCGTGRFEVQMWDGTAAHVILCGKLRFKGSAGSKTDREYCIQRNDLVVIQGGMITGKLTTDQTERVQEVFQRHGVKTPAAFFGAGGEEDQVVEGLEWDRSEEPQEEKSVVLTTDKTKPRTVIRIPVDDDDLDIDAI
jgi:hypothetical protein